MDRFSLADPRSVAEAASLAKRTVAEAMLADQDAVPDADCVVLKAGGIDLLDLMKEGLLRPDRVVNLRELSRTRYDRAGGGRHADRRDGDVGAVGCASMVCVNITPHSPMRPGVRPARKSAMSRPLAAICCNGRVVGIFARRRIIARAKAAIIVSPSPARTSITQCLAMTAARSCTPPRWRPRCRIQRPGRTGERPGHAGGAAGCVSGGTGG